MELLMLVGAIIFFVVMIKSANKVKNSTVYKNATPEEQKQMLKDEAKQQKEQRATKTSSNYDYGDSKSAIPTSTSTSSSSSLTYNNPSTGLPMTNGIGGVDAGGTPYGV